jgi:TIR domain
MWMASQSVPSWNQIISWLREMETFAEPDARREPWRVWYAPEDMKGGKKLHEEIFRAIQIHDKLLLVLSDNRMKTGWVITEIRRARKVERKENPRKLFPIRLVNFEAIQKWEML